MKGKNDLANVAKIFGQIVNALDTPIRDKRNNNSEDEMKKMYDEVLEYFNIDVEKTKNTKSQENLNEIFDWVFGGVPNVNKTKAETETEVVKETTEAKESTVSNNTVENEPKQTKSKDNGETLLSRIILYTDSFHKTLSIYGDMKKRCLLVPVVGLTKEDLDITITNSDSSVFVKFKLKESTPNNKKSLLEFNNIKDTYVLDTIKGTIVDLSSINVTMMNGVLYLRYDVKKDESQKKSFKVNIN